MKSKSRAVTLIGVGLWLWCGADSANGQAPFVRTSLGYVSSQVGAPGQPSTLNWSISKTDGYNNIGVQTQLRDLTTAALIYSNNGNGMFPELASELFDQMYVPNPLTFYNPGDVNEPPVTINNDVPNAANSSRISFDYFGAGHTPFDPTLVVFQDNTPSNNFGLGRATAYADGHVAFVPSHPHVFQTADFQLRNESLTQIYHPLTGSQPYSTNIPVGTRSELIVAPHRFELEADALVNDEVHEVFWNEGYGDINYYAVGTTVSISVLDLRVNGPAGMVPVTVYLRFSATLSRALTDYTDSLSWNAILQAVFDGHPPSRDQVYYAWTHPGLFQLGEVAFLEHHRLEPGDTGYLGGHDSIFVRGVAQLTVELPANETGVYSLLVSGFATTPIDQLTIGAHKDGQWLTELPVTQSLEQIVLFAPIGYEVEIVHGEPADLIRTAIRGDYDLDGVVSHMDIDGFEDAYSHPLVGHQFAEPGMHELVWFDFDGDADVDCVDWVQFVANWSGDPPAPFPGCGNDSDGDGVADGDDDCPATPIGMIVDDRGCPRGDIDGDGDVDLSDWSYFVVCQPTTTSFPLPPAPYLLEHCWNAFDRSGDRQVGLVDAAVLMNEFTGSGP